MVYIDDIIIISPPELAGVHFQFVKKVMRLLGFDLTSKEDGLVEGKINKQVDILGLNYKAAYKRGRSGIIRPVVTVTAGQDRMNATIDTAKQFIQTLKGSDRINYKDVHKVFGLLAFICYARDFR